MTSNKDIDRATGRAKEAAGALTADRRPKNEGHLDHAKGSAKNPGHKVADTRTGTKTNNEHL